MVKSILFTGDCPAARAVHKKKDEELRQQQHVESSSTPTNAGDGSAAEGAAAYANVGEGRAKGGGRSKSSMRKTIGKGTYAASVNPLKKAINEYLARLANVAHAGYVHIPPRWPPPRTPLTNARARAHTQTFAHMMHKYTRCT